MILVILTASPRPMLLIPKMKTLSLKQAEFALTFLVTSIRLSSSLTTSINLRDPSLLRTPSVTFHRESLQVFDPAATTREIEDGSAVIALVEAMNRADAKKAIDVSSKAFDHWRFRTTAMQRSKMLSRWSNLITENLDDLGKFKNLCASRFNISTSNRKTNVCLLSSH